MARDIINLWNISQRLVQAAPDQLERVMGPGYSLWEEFPEDPGQAIIPFPK